MRTPPRNVATSLRNYALFLLLALLSVAGASSLVDTDDTDDTYFNDRHKRRPRDHNAPCAPLVDDRYGSYHGNLSGNRIEVEVPYLVEVESTLDVSTIRSDVNPAVERRIVDRLRMEFFECDARRRATTTTTTRQLRVLGIETIRPQYFVGDCASARLFPSSVCSYVRGRMVLHFGLDALETEKNEVRRDALRAVKDDMEDGVYSDAHESLLRVAYAYDDGWSDDYEHHDDEDDDDANTVASPSSGRGTVEIYGTYLAVGVCALFLVLATAFTSRKLLRRPRKVVEKDGYDFNDNEHNGSDDGSGISGVLDSSLRDVDDTSRERASYETSIASASASASASTHHTDRTPISLSTATTTTDADHRTSGSDSILANHHLHWRDGAAAAAALHFHPSNHVLRRVIDDRFPTPSFRTGVIADNDFTDDDDDPSTDLFSSSSGTRVPDEVRVSPSDNDDDGDDDGVDPPSLDLTSSDGTTDRPREERATDGNAWGVPYLQFQRSVASSVVIGPGTMTHWGVAVAENGALMKDSSRTLKVDNTKAFYGRRQRVAENNTI